MLRFRAAFALITFFVFLIANFSACSSLPGTSSSTTSGSVWGFPYKAGTTITLGCLGLHDDNIYADGQFTFNNAHPQGLSGAPPFKCPPDVLSATVDPTHANEASLDLLVSSVGIPVVPLASGTVIIADENCHFVVIDHGNNTWVAYLHIDVNATVGEAVTTTTIIGTTAAPHTSTCEISNATHVHFAFMTGSSHTGSYISMVGKVLCGYQVIKNQTYPYGALQEVAQPNHIIAPNDTFTIPQQCSSGGSPTSTLTPTNTPVPANIYVETNQGIFDAIDAKTGQQKWRFTDGQANTPLPTVLTATHDTIVFKVANAQTEGDLFPTVDLFAVDATSGKQKWHLLGIPIIGVGSGYIYSYNGTTAVVFDAETGQQIGMNTQLQLNGPDLFAINDDGVYFGSSNSNGTSPTITAITFDLKQIKWKHTVNGVFYIPHPGTVISSSQIVTSSHDVYTWTTTDPTAFNADVIVSGINTSSGSPLFVVNQANGLGEDSDNLTIVGNEVYLKAISGRNSYHEAVSVFDSANGASLWNYSSGDCQGGGNGPYVITSEAVFLLGCDGIIKKYGAHSGHVLWQENTPSKPQIAFPGPELSVIPSEHLLVYDLCIFTDTSGQSNNCSYKITVFDSSNGTNMWQIDGTLEGVTASNVYVSQQAGTLLALNAMSGKPSWQSPFVSNDGDITTVVDVTGQ